MRAEAWDTVVLHDWTHHSGEFGERLYRVRRVKTGHSDQWGVTLLGLVRVEWFNPEQDGTNFEWEHFATHSHGKE